jgi:hypothetical protein
MNYTSDNKVETRKKASAQSAAVFNATLTTDDGQCRPKHVMY